MSMPATTADLVGDPEPMQGMVSVYGSDDLGRPQRKPLFHVWAKSAKSAWDLVVDAPQYSRAEVAYFAGFGPGVPERVWRDAVTRSWRSK
jgi:hypothetical protein